MERRLIMNGGKNLMSRVSPNPLPPKDIPSRPTVPKRIPTPPSFDESHHRLPSTQPPARRRRRFAATFVSPTADSDDLSSNSDRLVIADEEDVTPGQGQPPSTLSHQELLPTCSSPIGLAPTDDSTEGMIFYGTTECSPVITGSRPEGPIGKWIRTVGKPLGHVEVKIVDNENRVVPLNNRGQLCARGYLVFLGYYNNEQKIEEEVQNGWYYTGQ
uniref:Medium-chain acyl-CoA ligase ACSF2, mitochondrial n=2 Tax=Ixodes scapularis TaxID=6945 RepID=A0A1S4LP77_IXOSC